MEEPLLKAVFSLSVLNSWINQAGLYAYFYSNIGIVSAYFGFLAIPPDHQGFVCRAILHLNGTQ